MHLHPIAVALRFSTEWRAYKYFHLFEEGLNVEAMSRAAGMLVGYHDFRNFCTLDSSNYLSRLKRTVMECSLEEVSLPVREQLGMRCVVLSIRCRGFLYN